MDELIEALQIAKKYSDGYHLKFPTNCSHDELALFTDHSVSSEDYVRLRELSFYWDDNIDGFVSTRYGSC